MGEHAQIVPHCDLLSVWTQAYGLRLFDPHTGVMTAPLPRDSEIVGDLSLGTGAIAIWSDRSIVTIDRIDLQPRWYVPRDHHGRVFAAGKTVIEETKTEVIARDASTGHERWRWPAPTGYESMDAIDGKLVARRAERGVDVWDEASGQTLWQTNDYATLVGRYVVTEAAPIVGVADANGKGLASLRGTYDRIDAMAADGDTLYLATSNVSEYGGIATVVIDGFELPSKRRVYHATLAHVVRRYASTPPDLWVPKSGPIYYYEVDNGILTALDRTTGAPISTLGVGDVSLYRTPSGFAALDEGGIVEVIEPSETESPRMEKVRVEGTLTLDGKPMPNIEVVVGNVLTKTGVGGRYAATLDARGRFWVKVKQPTSQTSIAYWPGADTVVVVDGRSDSYVVNLAAHRDYME